MDAEALKRAAAGRWPEILSRLGGIDQALLDRRHHPCPKCGGQDRFSLVDEDAGALLCRKCFPTQNGDGIAAIQWLLGCEFPEACDRLGDYLGLVNGRGECAALPIVEEMARRKKMPLDSFKAFGAHEDKRGDLTVARVPMFNEQGEECSHFDMCAFTPKFEKGYSATGKPVGLFLTRTPQPGETVLLTEGVKDAAALHGLGFFSVGLPTSEMAVKFARLFRGCDCIIVPDRDEPGHEGADLTASRLSGIAASVKVATLPAEMKASGGDGVREILAKRNGEALLRQAIADAQPWSAKTSKVRRVVTMIEACHGYIDALADGTLKTFPSGLAALDDAIGGGAAVAEMVVIGARPSHGKTMFALRWLDHAASERIPGLIVSEEMSAMALGKRALHSLSEIEERDWKQYAPAVHQDVNSHYAERETIYIAEACGHVERAVEVIEQQVERNKVGIVAVDYATLLRGIGGNAFEQATNVCQTLKQCAARLKIVLLLLCQLNREIEKRPDRKARMSDLRQSGQFEQDADVILFLQWPLQDDKRYKPYDEYRIQIEKNRNRPIKNALVLTKFIPSRQKFAEGMEAAVEFNPDDWNR